MKLLFGQHLGITNKTTTGSKTKTSSTIMIAAAAAPPELLLLELAAGVTFGTVMTIGSYDVEFVVCVVVFVY